MHMHMSSLYVDREAYVITETEPTFLFTLLFQCANAVAYLIFLRWNPEMFLKNHTTLFESLLIDWN